jgi:hypothetical protein
MKSYIERTERRALSEDLLRAFKFSREDRLSALKALRAFRPERRNKNSFTITYRDLICLGHHPITNLEKKHLIALMPEVIEFLLKDPSCEDDWAALIFIQSVLRNDELYKICNSEQRSAIRRFISFLLNYKIFQKRCELWKDDFEAAFEEWSSEFSLPRK